MMRRDPVTDAAFAHGVRFHVAPGNSQMPPRHVMLLWPKTRKSDGSAAAMIGLDEAWPADIPKISAVVVADRADLDEAIALVGKHLGHGAH